jgi:hypothetical protein
VLNTNYLDRLADCAIVSKVFLALREQQLPSRPHTLINVATARHLPGRRIGGCP